MKEQLALLLVLQQIDSEIDRLKQNYSALDPGKAEAPAYGAAKTTHEQAKQTLTKTKTDIQDAELEQQSLQAKRTEVEGKLYSGKVTAPKEMLAMQEEILMFERQRERLEDKLIALMTAQENQIQAEAETKQIRAKAASVYKVKQTEYKAATEALQAEAKILVGRRKAAAAVIPPALLTRYESLRQAKAESLSPRLWTTTPAEAVTWDCRVHW